MGEAAEGILFGTLESVSERKKGWCLSGFRGIKISSTYTDSKRGEGALRAPSPLMEGSCAGGGGRVVELGVGEDELGWWEYGKVGGIGSRDGGDAYWASPGGFSAWSRNEWFWRLNLLLG